MADELLSADYKAQLVEKHRVKPWGGAGASWVPHLLPIIDALELERPTVLDYGCGRGTLKVALNEQCPAAIVAEFDPAIPGRDSPPCPADCVVCTDVMEHCEPQFIDATLKRLADLSRRVCFMNIACDLSKSLLPDGRNCHLVVKPPEWWVDKVKRNFGKDFEIRVFEKRAKRVVMLATRRDCGSEK
jgi:SAM-dependent methyltransferase